MLSLYVDLRPLKDRKRLYTLPRYRCGVRCSACSVRRYRTVGFMMNLGQDMPRDSIARDKLVRDKVCQGRCSNCERVDTMILTHCCGRV